MTKKKIKEEIKKPDFLLSAYQYSTAWAKSHVSTCIIAGVVVLVLAAASWGYASYRAGKEEKAQYMLSQGIRSFEEYSLAKKGEALEKAETTFKSVAKESSGGVRDVARLYLARIAAIKGKKDEAKGIYAQIAGKPSNDVVKKLSESALKEIEPPQPNKP